MEKRVSKKVPFSIRVPLHYATHDTHLTYGHRKLRQAEDFEILRLAPDFETLRLTCDFKTLHLTPTRRNISKSGVRHNISKLKAN